MFAGEYTSDVGCSVLGLILQLIILVVFMWILALVLLVKVPCSSHLYITAHYSDGIFLGESPEFL